MPSKGEQPQPGERKIKGTPFSDRSREEINKLLLDAIAFKSRYRGGIQQDPPFENYIRVRGQATLNGIVETANQRRKKGQKSIIFIGGSLGEGKTTIYDKISGIFGNFDSSEVVHCTAERGLETAVIVTNSDHRSGTYDENDYGLGSAYFMDDINIALNDPHKKLVLIEAPATTGIYLRSRSTPLGMDRGTSAILKVFGENLTYQSYLVGAIGLTNRDFKKGLFNRMILDRLHQFVPRGGTYKSTRLAEEEFKNLLRDRESGLAELFKIPEWATWYYDNYRREIQLARLEWLFTSYFQFPSQTVFIGEGSFGDKEPQPPVLLDS